MKQRKRSFLLFIMCLAAVFGAMTWLTKKLLDYEQNEQAIRQAEFNRSQRRTALWRMDSALGIFLTQESSRPFTDFFANGQPPGPARVTPDAASPLLHHEPDFCKLHFQLRQTSPTSMLTSPRYPTKETVPNFQYLRDLLSSAEYEATGQLVGQLRFNFTDNQLWQMAQDATKLRRGSDESGTVASQAPEIEPQTYATRTPEWAVRQQNGFRASSSGSINLCDPSMRGNEVETGIMAPYWFSVEGKAPELFLFRMVYFNNTEEIIQGVWLDWPRMRTSLLAGIEDLVPSAELVPTVMANDYTPERSLTAIRATLNAPETPPPPITGLTALRKSLVIAWCAVLVALTAIAIVLHASMELGERRGQFVSAVTHELRTPLTTFCLYSEMLADGLVRDEAKKREYMVTLKRESMRLAKIVENVLCYARLSEVRPMARVEDIEACELLARTMSSLERRAAESSMRLVVDTEEAHGALLHVDPQTVERILMNLVENACRYASATAEGGSTDPRIHVIATAGENEVRIVVADHGPGVPVELRKKLFRAFNRAGRETNNAAPGLGLGLSLSRGLARAMGGDLVLLERSPVSTGAAFEVRIPAETARTGVAARATTA